jgi:YegS/Rv2252/BmrU family lipid kinase
MFNNHFNNMTVLLQSTIGSLSPRRLVFIYNPASGGPHRRFQRVRDELLRARCAVISYVTTRRGDAEAIAARLLPDECDRLIVAGGDGTVNEVVNGLAKLAAPPPLAIVPLGTANVLAAELGLALAPKAIARAILDGPVRRVSLGEMNGRRFVLMAGVGFDAAVVATVDVALKRRVGRLAYVLASLAQLAKGSFRSYTIVADGETYTAHSAVMALAQHYAGPWIISHSAGLDQPSFQLCLFERAGRAAVARYAFALMRGRLEQENGFRIVAASALTVTGVEGEPVQADGDIVAQLPATLSVTPEALQLVFPA